MKYFAELTLDKPIAATDPATLAFELEADSAPAAMILLAAYCKGRFEASGIGAEVERLAKTKTRGVGYRRL